MEHGLPHSTDESRGLTSPSTPSSELNSSRRDRARGRWQLLRTALLGKADSDYGTPIVNTTDSTTTTAIVSQSNQQHSIHCFPGYHPMLLTRSVVTERDEEWEHLQDVLQGRRYDGPRNEAPTSKDERPIHIDKDMNGHHKPNVQHTTDTDTSKLYGVYRYTLSPSTQIFVRERLLTSGRRSLQELTCHRHSAVNDDNNNDPTSHSNRLGVDNTGNICVWDCEKVLGWFLHQSTTTAVDRTRYRVVLELGSGMAALAALSFMTHVGGGADQIYITDGHPDCVSNNAMNVRLNIAMGVRRDDSPGTSSTESDTRCICTRLVWNYQDATLCQADCTLISDCTHFENWHGELLWTAVRNTKVGGVIWMCQPHRGGSWKRFWDLINQTLVPEFCGIEEIPHPTLNQMHEQFVIERQESYDPDRHQPHIYRIDVLRGVTQHERDRIQQWIAKNRSG